MHDPENSFYVLGENWAGLSEIVVQVSNVVPRVFLNTDLPHVSQELYYSYSHSPPAVYSEAVANSLLLEVD